MISSEHSFTFLHHVILLNFNVITFRVSRRPREMYCAHACLCVCLSAYLSTAACPHYCTDPDVTWGCGRGCPLVVHIGWICNRCMGCFAMATLWKCMAEPSGNLPGPVHARTSDKIVAPAACVTSSATRSFHFVHTVGVV